MLLCEIQCFAKFVTDCTNNIFISGKILQSVHWILVLLSEYRYIEDCWYRGSVPYILL